MLEVRKDNGSPYPPNSFTYAVALHTAEYVHGDIRPCLCASNCGDPIPVGSLWGYSLQHDRQPYQAIAPPFSLPTPLEAEQVNAGVQTHGQGSRDSKWYIFLAVSQEKEGSK